MQDRPQLLSVIIPVYNEQQTISELIEKVLAVDLPIPMEIIVVDDGSTDGTVEILHSVKHRISKTHLSEINSGKGSAVRLGLQLAEGDIILIQDADLELDPTDYSNLLKPLLEGTSSVVYGSRFLGDNQIPATRRLANRFLTQSTNLLFGSRLTDMETAYKVFTNEVVGKLKLTAKRFEIEPEITAQILLSGYKITEVPITYRPRTKFEGKKIKWLDGPKGFWTLLQYRFARAWRSQPTVRKEPIDAAHPQTNLQDLGK